MNIPALADAAKDVDPDLRYMALEDFHKSLTSACVPAKDAAAFVPVLMLLLHDSVADVQNQAVRAFAPLVRHIDDNQTLAVVTRLYDEADATCDGARFSTSVPMLALRAVLQTAPTRFSRLLCRTTMDMLLARVLAPHPMTLAQLEVLVDALTFLEPVLMLEEVCSVRDALVECAFLESGLVSKRAVGAVGMLLKHLAPACSGQPALQRLFYDSFFGQLATRLHTRPNPASTRATFALALTVLAHMDATRVTLLSDASADLLVALVTKNLGLDRLNIADNVNDLDVDLLAQENALRDDVMRALRVLVPCLASAGALSRHMPAISAVLDAFVAYNPLAAQDASDASDDDVDFSDEDILQDGLEGLAAPLRALALAVLRSVLACAGVLPTELGTDLTRHIVNAVAEENASVAGEAVAVVVDAIGAVCDKDASDASGAAAMFARTYVPLLEMQIFDGLLTTDGVTLFARLEVLIETLVWKAPEYLSAGFADKLTRRIMSLGVSLKSHPDVLGLYEALFATYSLDHMGGAEHMLRDLADAVRGLHAYSSAMAKYLHVCGVFFGKKPVSLQQESWANTLFFSILADSVNSPQHSVDVRQQLLCSLTDLLVQLPVTSANQELAQRTLAASLNYEATVGCTVECLTRICEHKVSLFVAMDLSGLIIEKLGSYHSCGDRTLIGHSLTLMQTIFARTVYHGDPAATQALGQRLATLLRTCSGPHIVDKALVTLGYIVELQPGDGASGEAALDAIARVVACNTEDASTVPLEFLAAKLVAQHAWPAEELYSRALALLDRTRFAAAKVLCVFATRCEILAEIRRMESALAGAHTLGNTRKDAHTNSQEAAVGGTSSANTTEMRRNTASAVDDAVFAVHFMGCVALCGYSDASYDTFFGLLDSKNEHVAMAAARALGISVFAHFDKQWPALLRQFEQMSAAADAKTSLLLVSLQYVLKHRPDDAHAAELALAWDTLVGCLAGRTRDFAHADVPMLKLVGEVLYAVTSLRLERDWPHTLLLCLDSRAAGLGNGHLAYAMIVVAKLMLSEPRSACDARIVKHVVSYLPTPNLDLKQAVISTVLSAVYSQPTALASLADLVILPLVFDELSAKAEFRKVIPMGPYKYVVDEGLEVRKLSYELINAIVSVSDSLSQPLALPINRVRVIEVLLAKGLPDRENDIVNLAAENLAQLIQRNPVSLEQIRDLSEFIQALTNALNRTLRNKATTQEAESHGDTLRAVIKLSKVVNGALVSTGALTREWSTYYNDLKVRHQLLFHATD